MGILGTSINPLDSSPVVVRMDNITSNHFKIMLQQKMPLLSQTNRTLFNRSILLLALRILLRNNK
jgi:predicted choloylglycine hydrolase